MVHKQFTSNIIRWYYSNKRDLPWRKTKDPYLIWISEIILQQTKVSQGLPYYQKIIKAFPTVDTLARATEQNVLLLWQGLGYYSRARNMHKCAKIITTRFNKIFPNNFEQLLKLPGIGPYTAAAIHSFAFNNPSPVVDGNVYRVLARVFGIKKNIADAKSFQLFFKLSGTLIDPKKPANYNQAIMDLGATVCVPQKPNCFCCPIEKICFAKTHKKQKDLPIKIKNKKNKKRYFTYLVIEQNNKLAMVKRKGKGIWEGLFEFYLIETKSRKEINKLEDPFLKKLLAQGATINQEFTLPKHILSHQTIYSSFFKLNINHKMVWNNLFKEKRLTLYSKQKIKTLPKPVLISNYLNNAF